jgi:hypothetical protein
LWRFRPATALLLPRERRWTADFGAFQRKSGSNLPIATLQFLMQNAPNGRAEVSSARRALILHWVMRPGHGPSGNIPPRTATTPRRLPKNTDVARKLSTQEGGTPNTPESGCWLSNFSVLTSGCCLLRNLFEETLLTKTLVIISKDEMLRRILSDYLEMPDLRLSLAQAQRVWEVDEETCTQLLESLTEDGLLHRNYDGTYTLPVEGSVPAIAN